MQFNPLPYSNSQIEKGIKNIFKIKSSVEEKKISLFFINDNPSARSNLIEIPEASNTNIIQPFSSTVVPTFKSYSSDWICNTDNKIFYRGGKRIQVELEVELVCDANTDTDNLTLDILISDQILGIGTLQGRGYDGNTKIEIVDPGGGNNAVITPTIPFGKDYISGTTIINQGSGYINPKLNVISSTGVGVKLTPTISVGKITGVTRDKTYIDKSALSLLFKPSINKPNGTRRTYNLTLISKDSISLSIKSKKAGSSVISDCLVYQVFLNIKYIQ